jgi:hypothetical protein
MADDWAAALGGDTPGGAQVGGANTNTTADQLRNQVLSGILTTLMNAFPQATASISATATGGAATLPANPVAFLTITVGSTAYKLALYS